MKLNIELKELELDEANVVLAALQALKTSTVPAKPMTTVVEEMPLPNLDADGCPWDERIHSSNHKLNADGRWQRRRNVEDSTYAAVRSSLLGASTNADNTSSLLSPLSAETPAAPDTVIPATPIASLDTPAAPATPATPEVAPAPATPATPAEPAQPETNDLYTLMFAKLQAGFKDKKVDANYIQNTVQTLNTMFGATWTGLAEIKDNPQALKVVIDQLTKEGL